MVAKRPHDDLQTSSVLVEDAKDKSSFIDVFDESSPKKVRTTYKENDPDILNKEEGFSFEDPDLIFTYEELHAMLHETKILRNIKQQYDNFHQRQSKLFSTDVCCYVSPSSRRKKQQGGKAWGNQVLPVLSIDWLAFEDPPVVAFDNMLFATTNLSYCDRFENFFDNVFAVLQGSYSSTSSPVSICHLASVCVKNTSAPYYLRLDSDLPSSDPTKLEDNPFQYLFPLGTDDEANCEVASVSDTHLKAEVLVLRTTRPVLIGQQLCLAKAHFVHHITTERGYGRKLTWFKDVRVD